MEDSFKVRVEKLFGSQLFQSVPKSSFPTASWSVTDGEVERRQWNRERGVDPTRDETPCASAYDDKDGCFVRKPRKKALEDEDEEEEGGVGGEEGEIRASVGMDPTLDREDEEDEYDMRAVGKEGTGERIYMRDINDRGPFINYHSVVSDFFDLSTVEDPGLCRDPRADHFAANVRLNEDREIAENFCSVESSNDHRVPTVHHQPKPPRSTSSLKPILKRKENQMDVRPKKQVRFDPAYENSTKEVSEGYVNSEMTAVTSPKSSELSEYSPSVPDYIRNPSKYTCYTFDTSDKNDDELNKQAFEDFRSIISKSKSALSDNESGESGIDLPKSVVFTPRKKSADAVVTDHCLHRQDSHSGICRATAIAASEVSESESCAMDEDELGAFVKEKNTALSKMDRNYRSKATSDISECQ